MKTPTKRTSYRLAAVLSLAFAATGAWAADWTVSANTVLTEDKTVDELTVEDGVTLDLNGYKLYCSSVTGSGTITSPSADTDLTKPATEGGTFAMVTPSAVTKGSVGNLFNNNTYYSQGDNDRVLLDQSKAAQKLPLRIDYDFGEGNAKALNAYAIYVAWRQRAPKAWKFYGSNDSTAYGNPSDDGWVEIDSHSGVETWTKGSEKGYYAEASTNFCGNTTAYRHYRLKITEHVGSNTYFEMVQLEYFCATPGELHVNVASGMADWPASITFSGNVKVVKEGAGTLAGKLQLDDVELVIESGVVTANNEDMHIGSTAGKSASVTVNGGKLSVNRQFKVGYNGSGTLTVNNGIVEVASDYNTYIAELTGASGTINLNGGTLITRRVQHASGSSQTLNFNGGTLKTNLALSQYGLIRAGITVNVGENGGAIDSGNLSDATSGSRVYVAATIGGTGAMRFKGGKTINIEGEVNCAGGAIVELGTRLVAANEAAKNSILGNLAVDGITYTEDTPDIPVFQYTSDLTDPDDLAHVSFLNCGEGTASEISGTQILVDFVAPAWELDADHLTWSSLVAKYGAPASDARVIIKSDTAYTLTIDQDVTVGKIAFTGSGSVTLAVESGNTLTTDDIVGVGGITNNGTIVKTGSGTAAIPFNNASTGVVVVNAGTLKVASKAGTGTMYTVRVKGGATFDANGVGSVTVNVILEEGAFFVNTGSALGTTTAQTVSITLEGNATVSTTGGDFGLIGPSYGETALYLGAYTLTISGSKTFRLCKTTIAGAGTINVVGGTLTQRGTSSGDAGKQSSTGADCTLVMGSGTTLNIGTYQTLAVKNFTNNGTDGSGGRLIVKGILTSGNEINKLTLESGATVKATGTAQTIKTTFDVSGTGDKTIAVDASEIDAQVLKDAGVSGIDVLTVPAAFNPSGVTWDVAGAAIAGTRAKWRTDEGGTTKTLYIAQPVGLMVIFR